MQIIALSILLVHLSAFGGGKNTKPADQEADVKEVAAAVVTVQSVRSEVDEKSNKAREDLIERTARNVALRCMKANPWGARLMIDEQGETTPAFDSAAALPPDRSAALITIAKEQSYFYTCGYQLMRKVYEGVLEAALPGDIADRVVSCQQIIRCIGGEASSGLPGNVVLLIGKYAQSLQSLPAILNVCRDQWYVTGEGDELFSHDGSECREFCAHHRQDFPFPYDQDMLRRVKVAGFEPTGNCYRPDRVTCRACASKDQSDEQLGLATGLLFTWKTLPLYHKKDCAKREEALGTLTKRRKGVAREYGIKVPDSTKDPEAFLEYMLQYVDIFARSHMRHKGEPQTDLERAADAWVRGLAAVEDHALKAEAMIQYLKQKDADQAKAVGRSLAAAKEYFMASDAKKRRGSDDAASPE